MGYKVFLSHSASDSEWVKWIASNATSIGIETYLFEHDPQPGTLLAGKVKQAIQVADAVVVLLTLTSHLSPYVQQEVGFAEASGKLIIPLVQPGIPDRSLAMLQGREYNPFDFGNPPGSLSTLLSYLQRLRMAKENDRALLIALGVLIGIAILSSKS
ncbi:MAG: toll/interleukin-1 receptor domain-containing protein [Ignavibacteria bacterium]|nr:toll/interleukin-1 receptor domain-containing protein [Ignavibacteria bacterium]